MSTTSHTTDRPLTLEQVDQMWELFCRYGRLRTEVETQRYLYRDHDASQRAQREADELQERFSGLIWSLVRADEAAHAIAERIVAPDRS